MKQINYSLSGGIACLICFFALSVAIQGGLFQHVDQLSMIKIQQLVPHVADPALSLFSLLGSFEVTTVLLCIILFIRKNKLQAVVILIFFGLGLGIELLGKNFIYPPGPPQQFFRYDLSFIF